jgi:hypothetical protein
MKKTLALTLTVVGLAVLAWSGLPLRAQEGGRATLADLAWMKGSWRGEAFGGTVEEIWSAPKSGGMMGMFRLIDENGKVSLYEFLLIEADGSKLKLRFKHFGVGYEPWEKEKPLLFELESWTENRAQFTSPDPEQSPTSMLYTHPDDDQMLVTVGRGDESFDVLFKRADE